MIEKTEAIVLKRIDYRETSRIVTLLTRDFGKISVIAKGARDRRSRFGLLLDYLNHVQVILYRKEGRDLHLVTQADLVQRFPSLTTDLGKLGPAMTILELASVVCRSGEDGGQLFPLVVGSLRRIDGGTASPEILLRFETGILRMLGFQPELDRCVRCNSGVEEADGTYGRKFRLTSDGVLCYRCSDAGPSLQEIGSASLRLLRKLRNQEAEGNEIVPVPDDTLRESRVVLRFFLRAHVEGVKELKSETVFSALA